MLRNKAGSTGSEGMRVLGVILLMVFVFNASAAETVGGKYACLTKGWFEDVIKFVAADDMGSLQAYLDSRKCFALKDGVKVTIIEYPGMFGGIWEVAYNGQKFFVQREGIRDY